MTPRARGHHRSSPPLDEPFFDARSKSEKGPDARCRFGSVGRRRHRSRLPIHVRPPSIVAPTRSRDRAATGSSPLAADSSPSPPIRVLDPHGRSRGASRGRSMESTSREPSRGGHTMANTHCDLMRVREIVPRVYRHVGEQCAFALTRPPWTPRRISSLGTPTRARRCPDEEKERLGRRP